MTKFTKNKYLLTIFALIAFGLTIALGSLYARDRIALNEVLNEADAINFAYIDAGLSPKDVEFYKATLKKEDGEYVYKITFESSDAQYDYIIAANNGEVISSQKEFTNSGVDTPREGSTVATHSQTQTKTKTKTQNKKKVQNNEIASDNQVNTTNEADSNIQGSTKADIKNTNKTDIKTNPKSGTETVAKPKIKATTQKTKDSDKHTDMPTDKATDVPTDTHSDTPNKSDIDKRAEETPAPKHYINVDDAKYIALNHAGLSFQDVTFEKAVLKKDDGNIIYEIEFFTSNAEYEYEIDAYSGEIFSHDIDDDF